MAEETISVAERKSRKLLNVDLVVAATLGCLVVACFVAQVRRAGAQSTATETFLFNTLQFLLTTGFAWFSTKALSRLEFEQSLKKFAISAYRRIIDIERMVDRLHHEVRQMISAAPKGEETNLRIVDAIIADTGQVLRSSISDWGDVIGEELLAIERIKRLEHEKELLKKDEVSPRITGDIGEALKKIESSIANIESTLPAPLQLDRESDEGRTTRSLGRAIRWIEREGQKPEGPVLTAVTGGIYPSGRDPKSLVLGEPLVAVRLTGGAINVLDEHRRTIGRVINRSGESYDSFASALGFVYGDDPIPVEFLRTTEQRMDEENNTMVWIEVKITAKPVRARSYPSK